MIAKAREDAHVLHALCADNATSDAIWGFHAQQATEKLLKALLVFHGLRFPLTHRLLELADLLEDSGHHIDPVFDPLLDLTPYAVELRYSILNSTAAARLDRSAILRLISDLEHHVTASVGIR